MKKYKLRFSYDVVDIAGTKLVIFNDGSENAFIVNSETVYILCLLQQANIVTDIVKKIEKKYNVNMILAKDIVLTLINSLQENHLLVTEK